MSNGELITEGTTRRCVPLSQGALSPDLRVNYEFGLVLGVDEFRQEQRYHLENEYLHNRSLHGYGTVCGLRVTLHDEEELQVEVSPGSGIDQRGRTFIVRTRQCAILNDWLDQQDAPDEIDTIYVVARYDECLDALVPIRGEPCSSGDQYQAASRIRRAFQISLQTQPPPMPAWTAVQRLAEAMSHVQLVPDLADEDSAETDLIELVRLLIPEVPDGASFDDWFSAFVQQVRAFDDELNSLREAASTAGISDPKFLRLPADGARAALDRIRTVWVTEVCPQLQPDRLDPADDAEAGIVLARLERVTDGDEEENGEAVGGWRVRNARRPYLLDTQVIQSLLLPGGALGKTGVRLVSELISVDTFAHGQARRQLGLRLWFHTEEPAIFAEDAIQVTRIWPDGPAELPVRAPTAVGAENRVWEVIQGNEGQRLADGHMVEIRFQTDRVRLGERTLTEMLRSADQAYLGYDGETTLTVYYIVDAPPQEREEPGGISEEEARELIDREVDAVRTVPFVTITPLRRDRETASATYELWFHLDFIIDEQQVPGVEVNGLANLSENTLGIFSEVEGRLVEIPLADVAQPGPAPNIYRVTVQSEEITALQYVRFVFAIDPVNEEQLTVGSESLRDFIDAHNVKFDGYYANYVVARDDQPIETPAIVVYVRWPENTESL